MSRRLYETRPRHSRAEIRKFADWLIKMGWHYAGEDTDGHAEYAYPNTGGRLSLPETPKSKKGLIKRLRAKAYAEMGIQERGKTQLKRRVSSQQQMVEQRRAEGRAHANLSELEREADDLRDRVQFLYGTLERLRLAGRNPGIVLAQFQEARRQVAAKNAEIFAASQALGLVDQKWSNPYGWNRPEFAVEPSSFYKGPDPTARNAIKRADGDVRKEPA